MAIKLNPNNPLGKSYLDFNIFNYFETGGGHMFFAEGSDYINVFLIQKHMKNIGKLVRSHTLTTEMLESLNRGEDTYLTIYNNEFYALAGDYSYGILCQYTSTTLGSGDVWLYFVGLNGDSMSFWGGTVASQYILQSDMQTYDGLAYICEGNMTAGVLGTKCGILNAPFTVETQWNVLEQSYSYQAYHEINTSNVLKYSGDFLYESQVPPWIRKTPNLVEWNGNLIENRDWWFLGLQGAGLLYIPDAQDDGGTSGPGGGGGEPQVSIDIPYPDLPPDITTASGIIKMFNPTVAQMNAFVNFIYSSPTQVIDNFKKIWANPMDSIIQLSIAPFKVLSFGADDIKFCGVNSGVTAPVITNRYQMVDCGTLPLPEEYCTLLDYSDYTKVRIYLPFIGIRDLNPDDIIGATVGVRYHVDLLTGECVAFIKPDKNVSVNTKVSIDYNSPLYTFNGNILSTIPLTGNNWAETYKAVMGIITAAVNPTPASVAGVGQQILGQKVTVQRTGNIVGSGGMLGDYTPYIIIERPIRSIPDENEKYLGYPSNMSRRLSVITGYTEIESGTFRTNDFKHRINDEEAKELVEMLENGFILPLNERQV